MGSGVWNIKKKLKTLIRSRFQGMYWCSHKTTTLTSIQHTVEGGNQPLPPVSMALIYLCLQFFSLQRDCVITIYLFTLLGSLILYFEKFGLIYLCSEKHKFRNNQFWTFGFRYINIFCKKLKYEIKPNFSKYKIRPPLVIFSAFLEKNYNDKLKRKLSKFWTKWTGLVFCELKHHEALTIFKIWPFNVIL